VQMLGLLDAGVAIAVRDRPGLHVLQILMRCACVTASTGAEFVGWSARTDHLSASRRADDFCRSERSERVVKDGE